MKIVLVTVLFLIVLGTGKAETVRPLRVLIEDWVGEYGGKEVEDYNEALLETVCFLLAVKHINERRSDILPALALNGCARNISVEAYVDDGGYAAKSLFNMNLYANEIDAILGPAASQIVRVSGPFATVIEKPMVSHFATSPEFSDKSTYPFFARTANSDAMTAQMIVHLLHQMNYQKFALIYTETETTIPNVYDSLTMNLSMMVTHFPYNPDNPEAFNQSLVSIASLHLNIIVLHLSVAMVVDGSFVDILDEQGFLSNDKLFVFSDFDIAPSRADFLLHPEILPLFRGALRVATAVFDTTQFDVFLEKWTTEFATDEVVNFINSFLPPYGFKNNTDPYSLDMRNDATHLNISKNFFPATRSSANVEWAITYDAAVAVMLASCQGLTLQQQVTEIPAGKAFFNNILNVNFQGLSGQVSFTASGDRNPANFDYQVFNFDSTGNLWLVGDYDQALNNFNLSLARKIVFRDGSSNQPAETTPPPEQLELLPFGVKVLGYVEVAALTILGVGCLIWIRLNKNERIVVTSQRFFLELAVLGCIISAWSILPMTMDENNPRINLDAACASVPFVYSFGAMLSSLALLVKKARLFSLRRSTDFVLKGRREGLSRKKAFLIVFVGMAVDLALLLSWTFVNPLVWSRTIRIVDKNGFPLLSYDSCVPRDDQAASEFAFVSTLIVLHFLVLVVIAWLNAKAQGMPEEFQDSKYTALLLSALMQLYFLGVPVFIAVVSSPVGRFIVTSTFAALSCLSYLAFIFLPKMVAVRNQVKFRAWQESQVAGSSGALEIDFVEGMRNAHVRERFSKFAEQNYVIESFFFYIDVESFKAESSIQRAADIFHLYIQEGGLLQINISARVREQVTAAFKEQLSCAPSRVDTPAVNDEVIREGSDVLRTNTTRLESIFDPARAEIVTLLNLGAWRQFVDEGGMYKISSSPNTSTLRLQPSPSARSAQSKRKLSNPGDSTTSSTSPMKKSIRDLLGLPSVTEPSVDNDKQGTGRSNPSAGSSPREAVSEGTEEQIANV